MCIDTGYYEAYNRDNVRLVSIRDTPIDEITETGLRIGDEEFAFDSLVIATGFDAMTGALLAVDIRGQVGHVAAGEVGGRPALVPRARGRGVPEPLHDHGPGQPVGAEQHDGLDRAARRLDRRLHRAHARPRSRLDRADGCGRGATGSTTSRAIGEATLYPRAKSWYMGANIPGKPRVLLPYVGGVGEYRRECEQLVERGYEGFAFGSPRS